MGHSFGSKGPRLVWVFGTQNLGSCVFGTLVGTALNSTGWSSGRPARGCGHPHVLEDRRDGGLRRKPVLVPVFLVKNRLIPNQADWSFFGPVLPEGPVDRGDQRLGLIGPPQLGRLRADERLGHSDPVQDGVGRPQGVHRAPEAHAQLGPGALRLLGHPANDLGRDPRPSFGTWVFGTHRLGPGVWDHVCLGPVGTMHVRDQLFGTIPFGTIVWDHLFVDHEVCVLFRFGLGPSFGTMRVWEDNGCLGPTVWGRVFGTMGVGTTVWCLGPTTIRVFGTMGDKG